MQVLVLSPHSVCTRLRVSANVLTSYWFLPFEMSCPPPQLIVNDKSQNLRRLQAQRNELNAKGEGWGEGKGACGQLV